MDDVTVEKFDALTAIVDRNWEMFLGAGGTEMLAMISAAVNEDEEES
jgi:hypothetical protein